MKKSELTAIDIMTICLWRVFARYCEAVERGLGAIAARLDAEFLRRLRDYCAAVDAQRAHQAAMGVLS